MAALKPSLLRIFALATVSNVSFIAIRLFAAIAVLAMALPSDTARAVEFEVSAHPLVIETSNEAVSFTIELAGTEQERAQGLMSRSTMADDHGMLFDFQTSREVSMWMKNTILPLDMLFIRSDGVVLGIAHQTVPFSEAIIDSPGPIRYVLEINAGIAKKRGIAPGNLVRHPRISPD